MPSRDTEEVETFCELQQVEADEPEDAGEMSDARWEIFLLPEVAPVRTGDSITVEGEVYEIVGDPWRARNPRTREDSHIEVRARRTAGTADEVGS